VAYDWCALIPCGFVILWFSGVYEISPRSVFFGVPATMIVFRALVMENKSDANPIKSVLLIGDSS
jgi:hypothetical protein